MDSGRTWLFKRGYMEWSECGRRFLSSNGIKNGNNERENWEEV
jgi:hypothetical protein